MNCVNLSHNTGLSPCLLVISEPPYSSINYTSAEKYNCPQILFNRKFEGAYCMVEKDDFYIVGLRGQTV